MPPSFAQDVTRIHTVNESRVFEIEELFFSTTDKKGHIKKANGIFYRVSGFSAAELIDKPHNTIRHPDMPRIVFQLLWDEISAGRDVLAYVKNRAKDGRYYWVVALVTPIEGGYLSVRFKPSSELLPVVQKLYRDLWQIESDIENGPLGNKRAAIDAGREALDSSLRSLGFVDYRGFMRRAFAREIRSREAALANRTKKSAELPQDRARSLSYGTSGTAARHLVQSCQAALAELDGLFNKLQTYSGLNEVIESKSEFINSLSASIRILSMNGEIEAEHLGASGLMLGKVMEWLNWFSQNITRGCDELATQLAHLISRLEAVIFDLTSARLQIEMTTHFAEEIFQQSVGVEKAGTDASVPHGAMQTLYSSSRGTVERALAALRLIDHGRQAVEGAQEGLWKSIRALRVIYLKGKVELATVGSDRMATIFADMNLQMTGTEEKLGELEGLIHELEMELHIGVQLGGAIWLAIEKINPGALSSPR